ncbi:hypothetical protein, partial [Pedobacter africanus]|uniref:hypothetical protein n=1 Tax=Pedobacter africanus TaxID=151894 RepID=UPI001F29CCB5
FFKLFFLPVFNASQLNNKKYNNQSNLLLHLLKSTFSNQPHRFTSSEAGCKSRKKIIPRKLFTIPFLNKKLNSLNNKKKKLKYFKNKPLSLFVPSLFQ